MFYFSKTKTQTFKSKLKVFKEFRRSHRHPHILSFSLPQEYSHDLRQLPDNQSGQVSSSELTWPPRCRVRGVLNWRLTLVIIDFCLHNRDLASQNRSVWTLALIFGIVCLLKVVEHICGGAGVSVRSRGGWGGWGWRNRGRSWRLPGRGQGLCCCDLPPLLLKLRSPVLKPDLDLGVGEAEVGGHFLSLGNRYCRVANIFSSTAICSCSAL